MLAYQEVYHVLISAYTSPHLLAASYFPRMCTSEIPAHLTRSNEDFGKREENCEEGAKEEH
jgi:hypothetical protein